MISLKAGQLYWDETMKCFLLIIDRSYNDYVGEDCWLMLVFSPSIGTFETVKSVAPHRTIEKFYKKIC